MAVADDTETPQRIDPIAEKIEAVASLHARTESKVERHQRNIETVTGWFGRPAFLFFILTVVAVWVLVNGAGPKVGIARFDPPPFYWLQGIVGLSALLMTTIVLITQNRLAKIAVRREQLDLQVSMLTEHRTAKIIQLLEELRRDLPIVPNRVDQEAEVLQETMDPEAVLTALECKLEQALEEFETDQDAARPHQEHATPAERH